jgi:hypothetical protein
MARACPLADPSSRWGGKPSSSSRNRLYVSGCPDSAAATAWAMTMISPRSFACFMRSAAARRSARSARSGDSATMHSQARNRAASSGHRATATQLNQCSTKYRAGSRLYSSRARAVAAVQPASNLARAAGSRRATAARIAAGSRSGSGTTGCSPDTGRWLMKPMLTYPSDSQQASNRLRPMGPPGAPGEHRGATSLRVAARVTRSRSSWPTEVASLVVTVPAVLAWTGDGSPVWGCTTTSGDQVSDT